LKLNVTFVSTETDAKTIVSLINSSILPSPEIPKFDILADLEPVAAVVEIAQVASPSEFSKRNGLAPIFA
jgi:hypothetical protein